MTETRSDAHYSGGCACGAVRFEMNQAPFYQGHCQCRKCQHMTGTGHSSMMVFRREAVKVTGTLSTWGFVADSGQTTLRHFCPTCGSPVYSRSAIRDDVLAFNAGNFDQVGNFKPEAVCYGGTGHAWDYMDPDLPKFDTMPGAEIMART